MFILPIILDFEYKIMLKRHFLKPLKGTYLKILIHVSLNL